MLKIGEIQEGRSQIPLETMAQVISWTIFGAAIHWSQTKMAISSEIMAQDIPVMVMDGIGQLGVPPS